MNGEFEDASERRKDFILYAVAGTIILALLGLITFAVIRNRRAAEEVIATTDTSGQPAAGDATTAGDGEAPEATGPTFGLTDEQKAWLAEHPPEPIKVPEVELNVEKTMTAEELKFYGYAPDEIVRYKWVIPEGEGDFKTPVIIRLNEAPERTYVDADGDGLADESERALGTNPNNPDSDGDGVKDGEEVRKKTNPLEPAAR